jgi:stage II sporulation protein P
MMVGEELAKGLRAKGMDVYHDTTSYDGKNFSQSYGNARKGVQKIMQKNKFDLVIDLHRDGSANLQAEKLTNHYKINVNGKIAAQVMMVLTKGQISYSSLRHNWKTNAQVCTAIAGLLQSQYPGLLRKIDSRDTVRYNQDLHPHAILLEVGYEGNKTSEVLYTAQLLTKVIAELLQEQPVFLLD